MNPTIKRHPRLVIVLGFVTIVAVMLFWMGSTIWHRDLRKIQGVWVSDDFRFTVTGDIATLESARFQRATPAYFVLDSLQTLPRIKLWPSADRYLQPKPSFLGISYGLPQPLIEGTEHHGIYEIEGDRLRISLSPPAGEYPNSFQPTPQYLLLDLHRE